MCTSCNMIVNLNIDGSIKVEMSLSLYLIEMPFNAFANRADPDRPLLQELPDQGLLCLLTEI